ncbi:Hypothetical predicted protein [Scomber scombrus]|uniref:Uncharacterized protein n=1 Tax=Scomber scombrus TaxID=13677 RepID=A0AAV1PV35_SCOSC
MAITAANPEARLRSQEDHRRYPHRPGLPADAQEPVPHYWSQEHPSHEAGHYAGRVPGSLQPYGHIQGPQKAGVNEDRGEGKVKRRMTKMEGDMEH